MYGLVKWLSRMSAVIGGIVLVGLVLLTTLSIAGRELSKLGHALGDGWFGQLLLASGVDEIRGTYELTEAGVAFAIFAFFPVCQFYNQHATVDVFTSALPRRPLGWLRAFWEVVLAAVIVFIGLRLYEGMLRYLGNGETTLFLQFPVWWAYAASVGAAAIAGLTAVYCAWVRVVEAATGRQILPEG
ncbi:C4-dicarboxylate ABC transporter permease [Tateyamaria omphalii]|uniref:TRAP transporter small permease protein n=1 Tax=Tateyamaria omphalii TaxID=299262 RepID=A0A1P8MXG6_9RHOB|nr:TRAP transporter small permease [Tateyamaria omphalii]APX12698.1 C4-dicarboxylate ABC transporter permease [Tateyamaria omphalii]